MKDSFQIPITLIMGKGRVVWRPYNGGPFALHPSLGIVEVIKTFANGYIQINIKGTVTKVRNDSVVIPMANFAFNYLKKKREKLELPIKDWHLLTSIKKDFYTFKISEEYAILDT